MSYLNILVGCRRSLNRPLVLGAIMLVIGPTAAQDDLVIFMSGQDADQVVRLQDTNGDGDAHDPGEVSVFFSGVPKPTGVSNAIAMVALDTRRLLLGESDDTAEIVLAQDLDGNGDAFGAGESAVWFSGALPNQTTMEVPFDLLASENGQVLLLDVQAIVSGVSAVYRLNDVDGDGLIEGTGEIERVISFNAPGVQSAFIFDIVEGSGGGTYVHSFLPQVIYLFGEDGVFGGVWLDAENLFALTGVLPGSLFSIRELQRIPETGEIVFGSESAGGAYRIFAARDINGSANIDIPEEVRVIWDENVSPDGIVPAEIRDLVVTDAGEYLWIDTYPGRLYRAQDRNGDGDCNDAGETVVYYDSDVAAASGLPEIRNPLSLAAARVGPCVPADLAAPFGVLNFFDLGEFLTLFNSMDPTVDYAAPFGVLNFFDLGEFLTLFNAGCP